MKLATVHGEVFLKNFKTKKTKMNTDNKNRYKKILRVVSLLAMTGIGLAGSISIASAQSQQEDQIALQLGAIQLGYTGSSWTTNPQLLANAWVQGTNALNSTTTNKYALYVVTTNGVSTNAPAAQTAAFQQQLYISTLKALSSPITFTNSFGGLTAYVTVKNGTNGSTSILPFTGLDFDPTLTTASQVLSYSTARVPNLSPGLVSNAVAASLAYQTNSNGLILPTYGPQPTAYVGITIPAVIAFANTNTAAAQLSNAAASANAALLAAAKAYAPGTQNWAPVPGTGFPYSNSPNLGVNRIYVATSTNGTLASNVVAGLPKYTNNGGYLPNFGSTNINGQPVNLIGLANAAAAVSANAINGLGAVSTNPTALYGKTSNNVQALTASLIAAAAQYQQVSTTVNIGTKYLVYNSGFVRFGLGAIGASEVGVVTQVAGKANDTWGVPNAPGTYSSLLNGVVKGSVSAVGSNYANAVSAGVAEGFYITYLATYNQVSHSNGSTPDNLSTFEAKNTTNLALTFYNAYLNQGITNIQVSSLVGYINNGFGTVWNAASTTNTLTGRVAVPTNPATWNQYNSMIPGAQGIHLGVSSPVGSTNGPLINGVGLPVTDTVGL